MAIYSTNTSTLPTKYIVYWIVEIHIVIVLYYLYTKYTPSSYWFNKIEWVRRDRDPMWQKKRLFCTSHSHCIVWSKKETDWRSLSYLIHPKHNTRVEGLWREIILNPVHHVEKIQNNISVPYVLPDPYGAAAP